MRVDWVGGPLDGCTNDSAVMPPLTTLWIGPDITEPETKVIVYGLFTGTKVDSGKGSFEYRYDQKLTDLANIRQAEILGLPSRVMDDAKDETHGEEDL